MDGCTDALFFVADALLLLADEDRRFRSADVVVDGRGRRVRRWEVSCEDVDEVSWEGKGRSVELSFGFSAAGGEAHDGSGR